MVITRSWLSKKEKFDAVFCWFNITVCFTMEDYTASYNLALDNAIEWVQQACPDSDIAKYHLTLSKDETLRVAKHHQIPLHHT